MKIAMFRRVGVDRACVYETIKSEKDAKYHGEDFVQITDYIDVEFPPLTDESIVEQHLGVLDKAEIGLRTKFQAALGAIEQQRQELRAITYKPSLTPNDCPRCGSGNCYCEIAHND